MSILVKNCDYKYYHSKFSLVKGLIEILYNLEGCSCGGLCHVVIDDENLEDDNIKFTINDCKNEINKNRIETGLCELICTSLLEMTLEQRIVLFTMINLYNTTDYEYFDEQLYEIVCYDNFNSPEEVINAWHNEILNE